jgi:hypothetical protein
VQFVAPTNRASSGTYRLAPKAGRARATSLGRARKLAAVGDELLQVRRARRIVLLDLARRAVHFRLVGLGPGVRSNAAVRKTVCSGGIWNCTSLQYFAATPLEGRNQPACPAD